MNAPPPSPQSQSSIGFGLERIGVAAVRRPLIGTIAVAIISLIAAFGLMRLEFDDELRNVFRSNSADHQAFEQFEATFGATETDLFLLVEGDTLATAAALNALRDFTIDLRLEDGIASAVSLFSLRRTPDKDGEAPPVIPTEIPNGKDLRILLDAIDDHPLGLGKLISADRRSALVIIAIEEKAQGLNEARVVAETVISLAQGTFSGLGLNTRLTGLPELRTELVDRLLVDQTRVIVLGIALAFLLSGIMFRSVSGSIVTTLPAIVAVFWVLGLMGLTGVRVNLTTSILPVLILVLAFADSMHLSVQSLREQIAGRSRREAALAAIREVGPACVLAALTTSAAFLTLGLSDSYAIRQLGLTGAISTMLSFASVVVVGPLLFELTAHRSMKVPSDTGIFFHALTVFARFCWQIGTRRPLVTVLIGTLLVLAAAWGHSRLRPEFSFKEHLGNHIPAVQAMSEINREFGGSNPVHLLVPLPAEGSIVEPENLDAVKRVDEAVRNLTGSNAVLSFWSLARWLGEDQDEADLVRRLDELIAAMPEHWRSRLWSADGRTALVTVYFGDEGAAATLTKLAQLESAARAAVPDLAAPLTPTGFLAIAARESDRMIIQLNFSLMAAVFLAIALIGFAFRSPTIGLISLLPNIFPILVTGSFLVITKEGLHLSSAVALTIAFGIAVDNTIHFLNRYRHERQLLTPIDAVHVTNSSVGPVLVATTIVLCVGLGLTFISVLPMMRLFGKLAMLTFFAALIANLVYLPGLILVGSGKGRL